MKRFTLGLAGAALAAAVVSVSAQSPAGSPQDRSSQESRGQSGTAARSDSRTFVNDMAVAGMAEVQLGKLAADRAANADVKAFGQMMVRDHSKANDELKQVASQLNIQPTTQLDQKHKALADRLSKLKGAEFDREYMTAMVQGHEEVLAKLKERSGAASTGGAAGEQALTQWAAKTQPAVQQHLERARALQQKTGKQSGNERG